MSMAPALVLAIALLAPTSANAAEPAPPPSSEHRLSPEQVEKVLEEASRKRQGSGSLGGLDEPQSEAGPMPVHGEVGFSIGSGGYRSAYGTAVVGLPGDGAAVLSVGTQRLPDHQFSYPRR